MTRVALLLLTVACLTACSDDEPPRETQLPGGLFEDVTESAGISFHLQNGKSEAHHLVETMTGGVGWIDYDGDGWLDLYLPNGHDSSRDAREEGAQSDRLYRNKGDGTFEDVTGASGLGDRRYSNGVAVADFDNDGDSDLLVTNVGRNTLYRNHGDGTFEDVTESAGLTAEGTNASAVWLDFDRDGDLDLYIVRYVGFHPKLARPCRDKQRGVNVYCHPRFFHGERDLLYENLGGAKFLEIGARSGITKDGPRDGKGLGVIAADLDANGTSDIYVANDTTANLLWQRGDDGRFEDRAFDAGVALDAGGVAQAGMGVDFGDPDCDGDLDLHVTNFSGETNNLFLNDGTGVFTDAVQQAGLSASTRKLGFGTLFGDFDLDGDLDLVIANGHVDDSVESTGNKAGSTYLQSPDYFEGDGTGRFVDGKANAGAAFSKRYVGRGLASADFDNDGDLDLVVATIGGSVVLLRNTTRQGIAGPHYLRVRLRGTKSNRDGYGARIEVQVGRRKWVHEYQSARSYLSAVDPRLTIGLGDATRVDRLRITWPGGTVQTLDSLEADREIVVVEK